MIKNTDILSAIIDACQSQYRALQAQKSADHYSITMSRKEEAAWKRRVANRQKRIDALRVSEPILRSAQACAKSSKVPAEIVIPISTKRSL